MTSKEAKLKRRLDDLENELKSLHARVASKRQPLRQQNTKQANELATDSKPKTSAPKKESNRKGPKTSLEGKRILQINDQYWSFLQNISKNIAKGSEAIHKIASLTEISSLCGGGDGFKSIIGNDGYGYNDGRYLLQTIGSYGDYHSQKKKSMSKPQSQIHFSQTVLQAPSTPPTKENDISHHLESLKKEMEERLIDLQILKEKIETVKKKLRDERSRREIAEKAIASYKKRLAALEGKKVKDEDVNGCSSQTGTKEVRTGSVEKELKAEQEKRTEAEKKIVELMVALEETKMEIAKLNESKDMALKMADTFRERTDHQASHELKRIKADNVALQEELQDVKLKAGVIDSYIERAERAESELIRIMKQYNSHKARGTLNAPEVQEVIECHKRAYKELQSEMKYKETEFQKQSTTLESKLKEIKNLSDKKYKEMLEKYTQAESQLQTSRKNEETLKSEKVTLEKQVTDLNKRIEEVNTIKTSLEQTVLILKGNVQDNKEELEKIKLECLEKKERCAHLEKRYSELEDEINDREQTIESLRMELESEKDIVKIRDKMLQDQADTIKCLRTVSDNTKKTLDDERAQKLKFKEEVDKLKISNETLKNKVFKIEKLIKESEDIRISLKKKNETLKLSEKDLSLKNEVLENKISLMSTEKTQAMQTARFATEKLVQVINEYELKLELQQKLQNILNDALREKEYQLDVANKQINDLNDELWKTAHISEQIKNDLKSKLKMACEVCTDVLDIQIDRDF